MLLTLDKEYGQEMEAEQWMENKPDFMVFAEMDVEGLEEVSEFEELEF